MVKKQIIDAIRKVTGEKDIHLEFPELEEHGDYATNVAFSLAKKDNKNPHSVAEELAEKLKDDSMLRKVVSKIEVAGPGFINFFLKEEDLIKNLSKVIKEGESYGTSDSLKGKKIMVEFAHPNPFKAFHIGHLRNIFLGESIVRLLESQGAEVIRTNYQGDVGMHIAKCLWAFRQVDTKDYPKTSDERVTLLGKSYAQGATAFEEDPEAQEEIKAINKKIYSKEDPEVNRLWELGKKWSLDKFHEIYKRVYSHFDREYMESEVISECVKYITQALEKGILEKSDGAVIFDGKPYDLDTRVFLNSEGLPTYEGKELGLAYKEFTDFGKLDLCIHNVAVEQISFFKVTFKVEELLDPELFKGKQYHNAYEFVGLKKGKMSSRKGSVVLGEDILNEAHQKIEEIIKDREGAKIGEEEIEKVGVGAVKYSFLKMSPFKYLAFDLEESVDFEGNSGPYLQYTHARIQSILRNAEGKTKFDNSCEDQVYPEELSLMRTLTRFSEIIANATKTYSPNILCSFLFEVAQKYNHFYTKHKVIGSQKEEFRLLLTRATGQVIKNGLSLLGIQAPEKM